MRKPEKSKLSAKNAAYCGIMTAIVVVMSQLSFPLPSGIPVTLQTFAVALIGYFGGIWGCAALFIYLLLGMAGAPVFANFKGGISSLVGPTGGFLIGFIPMVILCAVRVKAKNNALKDIFSILLGTVGLIVLHLAGAAWFSVQSGNGFLQSFLLASAPYLVKDELSLVGGYYTANVLNRKLNYPLIGGKREKVRS